MNIKKYHQIRAAVAVFISLTVSISVTQDSMLLAVIAVITGMLFLLLVRSKVKMVIDEREKAVREKAAQITYAIFTPVIGLGSFFLTTLGRNTPYLLAMGQMLAYLTLFLIATYSLAFYFLNKRYGGGKDEE